MNSLTDFPFFIAEIGGNHSGSVNLAKEIISAAHEAGASSVKFQLYVTERFLHRDSQYFKDLDKERITFDEYNELSEYAKQIGISCFATSYDIESLEFLKNKKTDYIKVASCDLNNLPFLSSVGQVDCPVFISTGAAETKQEILWAIKILRDSGCNEIYPLHCTVAYPCPITEVNLQRISTLSEVMKGPVGFSDHTLGIHLAMAAIGLGACIIEKHFTIDRKLPGGDNNMSILPDEMARLIREGKDIWIARGDTEIFLTESEKTLRNIVRRSAFSCRNLRKRDSIRDVDIIFLRPGDGIGPDHLDELIGKRILKDVPVGTKLTWDMFDVCR